jgi:hypothetical protein
MQGDFSVGDGGLNQDLPFITDSHVRVRTPDRQVKRTLHATSQMHREYIRRSLQCGGKAPIVPSNAVLRSCTSSRDIAPCSLEYGHPNRAAIVICLRPFAQDRLIIYRPPCQCVTNSKPNIPTPIFTCRTPDDARLCCASRRKAPQMRICRPANVSLVCIILNLSRTISVLSA